jgi:hypothetical protein
MAEEIIDGTGSGKRVKVNNTNQLEVSSVSQTTEHYANETRGMAWHAVLEQTATGANDNIFYFKNTGLTKYVIEGFTYRVASAESILIYLNNNLTTLSGGTTIVPVNNNTGSSSVPTATIESGNNITGVTVGNLVDRVYLTSTETSSYNFEQDIVLSAGGDFMIQAVSGAVLVSLTIIFHESPNLL